MRPQNERRMRVASTCSRKPRTYILSIVRSFSSAERLVPRWASMPALISSIALSRTAWTMSSLFWKWYVMTPREKARRASSEPMVKASSPSSATILRATATIWPRRNSRRVSGAGMLLRPLGGHLTPEGLGPGRDVFGGQDLDRTLSGEKIGDAAADDLTRGHQAGEGRTHDAVGQRARAAESQAVDRRLHRVGE